MSVLCAVVASPPLTSGVRTLNALRLVGEVLGFASLEVVNLLDVPTIDINAMTVVGAEAAPWQSSRPAIKAGLAAADAWLAAWGVRPLAGVARGHRRAQIDWVVEQAAAHGHDQVWTVGPEPRHPSRWHQYVCDRHGRTKGWTASGPGCSRCSSTSRRSDCRRGADSSPSLVVEDELRGREAE